MKKDIKKSSYYVWFLGAEEAKGLRGNEFMVPVIRHLVEREKEVEPFKVTLQVSHKGLKIVQNVPIGYPTAKATKNGKTEVVKHFIPHHAITSVYQDEDIVSCILLLFNPVTKCPVHVHAYRCDSVETAEILSSQLQTLLERPENQKKLEEIESRLRAKGLVSSASKLQQQQQLQHRKIHSPAASGSSDGRSSARESELSGGSSGSDRMSGFGSQESRIANLYDSLAAELKEKLCTGSSQPNHAPILLPPRDYDTVHRQKGNLSGIDFRRCLNMNIVGMNAAAGKGKKADIISSAQASGSKQHLASPRTKVGSSGGSSGIGSDHAPSPDQESDNRFLDNQSTSDEEWNAEPTEDSLFLVQNNGWPSKELSLPRARRHNSSGFDSSPVTSPGSANTSPDERFVHHEPTLQQSYSHNKKPAVRSVPSSDFERKPHAKYADELRAPRNTFFDKVASKSEMKLDTSSSSSSPPKKRNAADRQRSPSPTEVVSPKERFKDAKEKFLLLERERLEEQEKLLQQNQEKRKSLEFTGQQLQQQQHVPVAKPRSSKNSWKRDGGAADEFEVKPRHVYRHQSSGGGGDDDHRLLDDEFEHQLHQQHQQHQQNQQQQQQQQLSENKRRSISSRLSYHRNKSMESLNSEEYPSVTSGSYKNSSSIDNAATTNNIVNLSRSKLNSYGDEDGGRYNGSRMNRYHNSEMAESGGGGGGGGGDRRRCKSPVNNVPRPAARSYSEDYLPDHHTVEASGKRYNRDHQRDMSRSQHSVPFANDESIPLQRYRSPTRQVENSRLPRNTAAVAAAAAASAAASAYPYPVEEESQRRVKRSDSKYYAKSSEHDKRRSMLGAIEDEKRRNSNEIAKEFKRRSYQDHRTGSEISYQSSLGYHEINDQDRYPVAEKEAWTHHNKLVKNGKPPSNGVPVASPRYRHSYAEPFHHHPPPISHHHEILQRTNSSLSSGRIGIAAIHHY